MVQNDPVQTLRMENARLHQVLAEALAQNRRLEEAQAAAVAELASLRAEASATHKDLVAQISALTQQIARSNERTAELLAIAQRKKRPEPKPRPPY